MENFILNGSGTAEIHLPNWVTKSVFLTLFGFNRCKCRFYESPVKSFRPKKVLIVFRQYLSHLTCSRVHSCCVEIRIVRHVTSCCVTSRRVMSRHVALCRIMSRHFTSCHVMSRHVTSRHVTSCHVMSRHVTWCTSCHVMSRHVTSRHVTSFHPATWCTSCHVMSHLSPSCPRHVLSCYVISRRKSRNGHAINASLSTDFFHTQSIQIKHDRVRWLSRRLPIQYRISGIWSSFFYSTLVLRNYSTDSHKILRNCVFWCSLNNPVVLKFFGRHLAEKNAKNSENLVKISRVDSDFQQ